MGARLPWQAPRPLNRRSLTQVEAMKVLAWIGRALAVVWREVRSTLVEFFEDEANPGSKAMGDAIEEAERTTHPRAYRRRKIRKPAVRRPATSTPTVTARAEWGRRRRESGSSCKLTKQATNLQEPSPLHLDEAGGGLRLRNRIAAFAEHLQVVHDRLSDQLLSLLPSISRSHAPR